MTLSVPFLSGRLRDREHRRMVEVSGSSTAVFTYEPVGSADSAAAPTILAVHGFRGTHHGLLRIVDALPAVRVVMPDLPGFGASSPLAGEHGITGYGDWLAALADALGLGPDTVLLGHSFGSIVVAHFLAAHPGRFGRLVLVNPISAPALEGPQAAASRLAELYYWGAAKLPARLGTGLLRSRAVVRLMSEVMAKTRDSQLRAFVHAQHREHFSEFATRASLLESFRASISHHAAEVAEALTLPVLLIAGERDEVAALPEVRRLNARLQDSRLTVIPGVGHLIHYETPEPAAAAIAAFLEETAA
ncbi:alpha/beta hydrolase [Sinomonas notoginsengisoli]|uniref:alpha/beta fold hydrolase n=1 Tax=Sinomonas notoginsengisoli TaxID=1457311 RepID=UPI001F20AE85|nr:alpha/beta hydrolase [Sinomonas notoginsengisoli]